jgi:hypothetical protein
VIADQSKLSILFSNVSDTSQLPASTPNGASPWHMQPQHHRMPEGSGMPYLPGGGDVQAGLAGWSMMGVENADTAHARPVPNKPALQVQAYASHQKKQQQGLIARKMGQHPG